MLGRTTCIPGDGGWAGGFAAPRPPGGGCLDLSPLCEKSSCSGWKMPHCHPYQSGSVPLPRPRRRGGAREGPLDHGEHLQGEPRHRHTAHPHQRGPTDPYAPCGPAAGMSSICFPVRTKTTGDKNSNKKVWGKTRKTFDHGKKDTMGTLNISGKTLGIFLACNWDMFGKKAAGSSNQWWKRSLCCLFYGFS